MIVYNFKDNLSCILGLGGISIDMVCNSQEKKLQVANMFKVGCVVKNREDEETEELNNRYFEWVRNNI